MIAKIAIFCLIGSAYAAPSAEADPQFLGAYPYGIHHAAPVLHTVPLAPVCVTEEEEIEVQSCAPRIENVCETKEITSQEITYEKKCKEVVSKQCTPGVAPVGATVVLKKREAEADPQFLAAPYAAPVAAPVALASPVTQVVKSACHEVVTEHCVNVPVPVEKVTPVETCHAVTKVDCAPAVQKVPKVVCEPATVEEAPAELEALKVSPVAY